MLNPQIKQNLDHYYLFVCLFCSYSAMQKIHVCISHDDKFVTV